MRQPGIPHFSYEHKVHIFKDFLRLHSDFLVCISPAEVDSALARLLEEKHKHLRSKRIFKALFCPFCHQASTSESRCGSCVR